MPLVALAALALACSRGGSSPSATAAAEGTFGEHYGVIVPRPAHGTVVSADERIRCGTGGERCGDLITGTRYEWSTAEVTLSAVADPGYHFEGWAGDCRGTEPACTVTRGADRTVVAVFLPDAVYEGVYFTVTVTRPVGGVVTAAAPHGFTCASDGSAAPCGPFPIPWEGTVTLTAAAGEGFVFRGWSGACSGKGPCTLTRAGERADKSVTARFTDASSLPPLAWDEGYWDENVWE